MDGERTLKRVRQACQNCRRKKTRCSGEMPICSFCARLNQPCVWDSDGDRASLHRGSFFNTPDSALAARVALLESKLSMLGADSASGPSAAPTNSASDNLGASGVHPSNAAVDSTGNNAPGPFASLPAKQVLTTLIDTYFTYCHNQPYAYFHEATFRQRFEEGALPAALLFAVAATACRFTEDPQYHETHSQAILSYSNASWNHIFQQSFSYEDDLDLTIVQAVSMLAVIDFTAGHPRHGWVKVALAVRFAQALRLNEEPDDQFPAWEREEQRRTFWSMYLLDRLISLGPNRPPTFSDSDCTVRLPSSDLAFFSGTDSSDMPTLEAVIDDAQGLQYQNLDYFALTALMACTLGQFIRYSLKRSSVGTYAPWDSRSSHCKIHGMLLQYESHSLLTYASLGEVLQNQRTIGTSLDQPRVGHLVFSQALFHVNHCLLNHPFVLYHLFQRSTALVPLSFAREALQRSQSHAAQLLDLVQEAQDCGRLAESSFFGYCVMLSGVIFRLYEHHRDAVTASESETRVAKALQYLERQPVRWAFHPIMVCHTLSPP